MNGCVVVPAGGGVGWRTHTQFPLRHSGRGHGDGEEGGNEAGASPEAAEGQPEHSLTSEQQKQRQQPHLSAKLRRH